MNSSPAVARRVLIYRVGPYEVDIAHNELRKFGLRVKLERKPLQLLIALAQHEGKVVTRGELQRLLWGEDLYVDFDKGLNVAITKLRATLNDSSEKPLYIETIAGEGYRFIAQVETILPHDSLASAVSERTQTAVPPSAVPDRVEFPLPAVKDSQSRLWKRSGLFGLAVVCIAVLLFGLTTLFLRRAKQAKSASAGKMMLVVLPFENLSGDNGQEYLADGMTEELSQRLGNLVPQLLGVIGRTSAMTYKHSSRTISQIGKDLSVGYVLEGSVRRQGNKLRVTAQLVEVSDQAHVWAQNYDQDARDVLQVEDSIAFDIARQVGLSMALNRDTKLAYQHVPSPEAHEAYLLARYYWNRRGPIGWQKAEKYFRIAIERDPLYAAAYAGLAECRIPLAEAKMAALKAVELDPTSGEARTALGRVQLFKELDVVAAEDSFKSAIQLDPNYAVARHSYGELLAATGRLQDAITEKRKAEVLDPLSLVIKGALAEALSLAGRQDEAEREMKALTEMNPHPLAHEVLGDMYARRGMYKEAIREYQASQANGGDPLWGALGYAYARSGYSQDALKMLAQLQALDKRSGNAAVDLAIVEIGLGNNNRALAWLEKAYDKHNDEGLLWLKVDPIFDPLNGEPRFQDLLRRMRLGS